MSIIPEDTHGKVCCGIAAVAIFAVIVMMMRKKSCNCEKFVPSAYFNTPNMQPESPPKLSTFYGNNAAATVVEDVNIMKTVI